MQGLLRGHEEVQLEWFFTPQREGPMLAKVGCLVSALDDRPDGKPHEIARQQVQVSGVGATGSIRAEPDRVDFGPVLVGTKWRRHITLLNPSDVALYYSISYERRAGTDEEEARRAAEDELDGDDTDDAPLLALSPAQVRARARRTLTLTLTLTPTLTLTLAPTLALTLTLTLTLTRWRLAPRARDARAAALARGDQPHGVGRPRARPRPGVAL